MVQARISAVKARPAGDRSTQLPGERSLFLATMNGPAGCA
jgi:hypothetical protein